MLWNIVSIHCFFRLRTTEPVLHTSSHTQTKKKLLALFCSLLHLIWMQFSYAHTPKGGQWVARGWLVAAWTYRIRSNLWTWCCLRNSSRRRRFGKKIAVAPEMSDSAGFWHMRRWPHNTKRLQYSSLWNISHKQRKRVRKILMPGWLNIPSELSPAKEMWTKTQETEGCRKYNGVTSL